MGDHSKYRPRLRRGTLFWLVGLSLGIISGVTLAWELTETASRQQAAAEG